MKTESARSSSASFHRIRRMLLGNVCVLVIGAALAIGSSPASAATKTAIKHKHGHKEATVSKEPFGNLAKGPLQVFVSINQQKLHFYSGGVHVVDEPVATGVPGHLTPMGVFSIIERDRYHHSNIYAGAPMPFMERITWSGVAMHEGVGLGHPASHGCIRMPHDFAARLWQLRTMGMRVIIARPELRPTEFADPHLFMHKDRPIASATPARPVEMAQAVQPGTKTDVVDPAIVRGTAPQTSTRAIDPAPAPETTKPAAPSEPANAAAAAAATAKPAQPATDASAADPVKSALSKGVQAVTSPETPPAKVTETPVVAPAQAVKTAEPAQSVPTKPATEPVTAGTVPAQAPDTKPATVTAAPSQPAQPAQSVAQPAAAPLTTATTPSASPNPAKADPAKSETTAVPPANITAPVKAALEDVPLPLSKPVQVKSTGPIAIFVSRKLHKIFVRQNFTPVFDAEVTIENPEQPVGTHVFTALDYMPDGSTLRWNVVSLPGESSRTVKQSKYVKDGKGHRRRVQVEEQVTEAQPSVAPQQALARIGIPKNVIDQISQLIVPGSSLVISDQGLGPETGSGTDFIVVTR